MTIQGSISEDNGIAALRDQDLQVYSVGISTGGVAEIRMAQADPGRSVIATTVDEQGLDFARRYIAETGLDTQIAAKLEDVSGPLPYPDATFDFVYARLVLHYLTKHELPHALRELRRVLKRDGRLFVVVRSDKCPDALRPEAKYEPATGLTTCSYEDQKTGTVRSYSRYFHTEASITGHVTEAGFTVAYVKSYDEQLYVDFMRTRLSPHSDNVIELLAVKS